MVNPNFYTQSAKYWAHMQILLDYRGKVMANFLFILCKPMVTCFNFFAFVLEHYISHISKLNLTFQQWLLWRYYKMYYRDCVKLEIWDKYNRNSYWNVKSSGKQFYFYIFPFVFYHFTLCFLSFFYFIFYECCTHSALNICQMNPFPRINIIPSLNFHSEIDG